MNQFFFYVDFMETTDGFYTYLGGVVTTSFESKKTLVETADYMQDQRLLIKGSGVQEMNITISGILEDYQKQFNLLFKANTTGDILPMRLDSGKNGLLIEGNFSIETISGESEANRQNTFSATLMSNGEIKVTKND